MKNKHGFSNILLLIIGFLILGIVGYFGYTFLKKPTETKAPETKVIESAPQKTNTAIQKPTNQRPTNEELKESIRKDVSLEKDEEIIIDGYDKSEKYEIVFARYQFAGHLLSKQLGSEKWVHEMGQQQGPAMYECKILDKLGFSKIECFNYDTQKYRMNGVYKN